MKDYSDLVLEIKNAWSNTYYPGDQNIFTKSSYDDEGITEYFIGTGWENHEIRDLREYCSALPLYFTPAAFHYWIPAYLIAALEDPDELSQGIDAIVDSFLVQKQGSRQENEVNNKLAHFSREQLRVTVSAIEAITEWLEDPLHPDNTLKQKRVLNFLYGKATKV
tara:strand:- start:497 stop:991 length:495 start_codon:yes stop_codon:yes gene_type:complete